MYSNHYLRPLLPSDYFVVREIYADAIESQGHIFYSKAQIRAWSALAWLPGILDRVLIEGRGWLSVEKDQVEAFAVRHPRTRLALLYCRGRSASRGHASALLDRVEMEVFNEGYLKITTEASLFSQSLLVKRGWINTNCEQIDIAGVRFNRFRMEKFFHH